MIRWLSPVGLASTAYSVLLAGIFGRYSDKREIEAALSTPSELDYSAPDEIWIDYVSDAGDGFPSTYTIARLLAQESLEVSYEDLTVRTKRGRILVMGGDQVYPAASEDAYRDRFLGPYEAALPCSEHDSPALFAIPGNHDWYDGLTTFLRLFRPGRWVGGWRCEQGRSYFAVKLPQNWWLWGIDIQLDFYIDEPQLEYFTKVAETGMRLGDRVILCTAKPSWIQAGLVGDESYKRGEAPRNLRYFESRVIRRHGGRVLLVLAGDLHHYARYAAQNGASQRITSGGGGAYLYPTHHLPGAVDWDEPGAHGDETVRYRREAVYPSATKSRRLAWGVLLLPFLNPSFWALVGVVHAAFAWIILFSTRAASLLPLATESETDFIALSKVLVRNPASLFLAILLLLGLVGFADARRQWERWLLMGGLHTLAHLAVVISVISTVSAAFSLNDLPGLVRGVAIVAILGGLAGSLLMGIYLLAAHLLSGRHPNEVFAAQHIPDYKNFIRLRIGGDGVLTVFPIGVGRIPRRWRFRPPASPTAPWFEPLDTPLHPALIEPPIAIDPRIGPLDEAYVPATT